MKSAVRSALTIALVGTIFGLAQTTRAEGEKKADAAKTHQVKGEITAVDTKANTVTIKHKTASMTFTVAPDVKYGADGEKLNLNLSNLKVGDTVTIHYTEDGDKKTAHKIGRVDISAKKAAKDEKKVATP